MKAAVLFDNLGPYHLARLRAAAAVAEVLAVEFGARSVNYQWEAEGAPVRVETVNPHGNSWELSRREFKAGLERCLGRFGPDVVFVPGWATPGALLGLQWCLKNRVPAVVMSESTAWDAPRNAVREAVKRWVLSRASAALVGGQPQRDYAMELGMPAGRVFTGYNIVDNAFFADGVGRCGRVAPEAEGGGRRAEEGGGPRITRKDTKGETQGDGSGLPAGPYFLASNRFIPKKNLFFLLEEYAAYCAACAAQGMEDRGKRGAGSVERGGESGEHGAGSGVWPLVLLGDGELREQLVRRVGELGLACDSKWGMRNGECEMGGGSRGGAEGTEGENLKLNSYKLKTPAGAGLVVFAGFRQVGELPRFYAGAGAFVHASLSEQWGLVVNEAMASGLPVLVSDRCGCAKDLVQDGVNGYTFVVSPVNQLAPKLLLLSRMAPAERVAMGLRGREIVFGKWGGEAFAKGFLGAAKAAMGAPRKGRGFFSRMVLEAFCARQIG